MLKSHFTYLQKAVGLAIMNHDSEFLSEALEKKRTPKHPVYRLIADIVCDARFYRVIDSPDFWKLYASDEIRKFVDAIDSTVWDDDEALTLRKEDFLNRWLSSHLMTLSEAERISRTRQAVKSLTEAGLIDKRYINGSGGKNGDDFPFGVNDMTQGEEDTEEQNRNLPSAIEQLDKDRKKNGRAQAPSHEACGRFLQSIDPMLLKLAKMIGRCGGMAWSESRFGHGRKCDINGITVGDDLNSLLPSEVAMLATDETHDIFLHNFTRKRLQIFSSASQSKQKGKVEKGAIIMCIDTSGSMVGEPERMAKTLAMTIALIAQKERRPVFVVNYSYNVSFFVLTNLKRQYEQFLSFLSLSYSGGNDENRLFNFLFSLLPKSKHYGRLLKDFEGADLLMISDFIWGMIDEESEQYLKNAVRDGMRIFSLEIGGRKFEELEWAEMPKNGEWFLYNSHHHFDYNWILGSTKIIRL